MLKKLFLLLILTLPLFAFAQEPVAISSEPRPHAHDHMTLNEVRAYMIKQSVDGHPGCPCPYSPDLIGGNCGTECQYYKAGGFRVKCYLKDISSREVYFFKLKYATPMVEK